MMTSHDVASTSLFACFLCRDVPASTQVGEAPDTVTALNDWLLDPVPNNWKNASAIFLTGRKRPIIRWLPGESSLLCYSDWVDTFLLAGVLSRAQSLASLVRCQPSGKSVRWSGLLAAMEGEMGAKGKVVLRPLVHQGSPDCVVIGRANPGQAKEQHRVIESRRIRKPRLPSVFIDRDPKRFRTAQKSLELIEEILNRHAPARP